MTHPMHQRWTAADVPDQRGRVAVVTGGSSGLGYETAKVLAARRAVVVLACRDSGKAAAAATQIAAEVPGAQAQVVTMDLASLASVHAAADEIRSRCDHVDLLINNAGVMWAPYSRTKDGYELHIGTNHLGHFALTGLLLDRLSAAPGSRVVTLSSSGHRLRRAMAFDDLQTQRGYQPMAAYARSKLANLLFTYELQRRLAAAGSATIAVAAHPGGARTDLTRHSPLFVRVVASRRLRLLTSWLLQDAGMGVLPTLRAATDPAAGGGQYYGPAGLNEWTGYPEQVESSPASHDAQAARQLWAQSERITGVSYPLPAAMAGDTRG
jgi:NAD(P)-dependent dehydrogenase (short-subunit alcohol dehydrogenase family)